MNQEEHTGMARELMTRAGQESQDGGNEMIAAELFWGAFAHSLITVAQNEGLPHDSHGAFKRVAQHLDTSQGGNRWSTRFGSAERLHFHFYHGTLPPGEMRAYRNRTTEGTLELLSTL